MRVTLLGELTDPIEVPKGQLRVHNNGDGNIWIYREQPVLLPAQTTFQVKLQFGQLHPEWEVGDWATVERVPVAHEGIWGEVVQTSDPMGTLCRIKDFKTGKYLDIEGKYLRRLSPIEMLAMQADEEEE